jgi:hypothetical protein
MTMDQIAAAVGSSPSTVYTATYGRKVAMCRGPTDAQVRHDHRTATAGCAAHYAAHEIWPRLD